MASIANLCSSSPISFHPLSKYRSEKRSRTCGRICAAGRDRDQAHHDHDYSRGGRSVDESMIVLRKRIHEMKAVERNYEPPSDWMEWEKEWFGRYDSTICELVGILQWQLMNTRPSVALGMIALVTVSVPMSTAVAISYVTDMISRLVSSGIHPIW